MSINIQIERIHQLNKHPLKNSGYVVYWMQSSQRITYNHALNYAIDTANNLNAPLIVYFALTDTFPEANARHYYFMLEGLKELASEFIKLNITFLVEHTEPIAGVNKISQKARVLITDVGYLRVERVWRETIARQINCACLAVESNVVLPVQEVSLKEEYSAATIRRKINKQLVKFLVAAPLPKYLGPYLPYPSYAKNLPLENITVLINSLNIGHQVQRCSSFTGGSGSAQQLLKLFITKKLPNYAQLRNDPSNDYSSDLSPYLHFGQISALQIALAITEAAEIDPGLTESALAFLEELIVRRELAINFVYYNSEYDTYQALPNWAKITLEEHRSDPRPYVYTLEQLETATSHDSYWNAAQIQLVKTGKMQGYLRMYWGKKILEWSTTPELAYKNALYLNNKYSLDGRNANAFAGIAWCFGKHDRPWGKRTVFGNVRYMNKQGLDRKFKMRAYLEKIAAL